MAKSKKKSTKKETKEKRSIPRKPSIKQKRSLKKATATANTAASATAGSGPVTLAEAKAMVQALSPIRAMRRNGVAKADTATLGTIALERQKMELLRQEEREQRIREYEATMSIMKHRGVKGLTSLTPGSPKRRGSKAVSAGGQPLQIFAEGDSWFDYPVPIPFFGGGLVPRLEDRLGVPILNLAKAGDEVRFMLGVEERKLLTKHLEAGSPAGGKWDVLLFSGGGNDIVDNPMALWIKDFDPGVAPAKLIHKERFEAALALVKAGYEDLIELRNKLSPNTQLVFHAYDFVIPDGRGICHLGPWLKPTFDLRRFPNRDKAFETIKAMLQLFASMLLALQNSNSNVTFINVQGTLTPQPSSWHNELHPSKDGFNKIAGILHQKLKTLFPTRVL